LGITAIYKGQLAYNGAPFTSLSIDPSWNTKDKIEIQVTFTKDDKGQELLEYAINGRRQLTAFLTSEGQYEVAQNGATLRPVNESSARITLGFLLPPRLSRTFIHDEAISQTPNVQACSPDDKTCQSVSMPIFSSGTVLHGQWFAERQEVQWVMPGYNSLRWKLEGKHNDLPTAITYEERTKPDQEPPIASATYHLTQIQNRALTLNLNDIVSPNKKITVFRNRVGFGPYDKSTDPWTFHRKEATKWDHLEKKLTAPATSNSVWTIIAGLSIAALTTIFFAYKLVTRNRK